MSHPPWPGSEHQAFHPRVEHGSVPGKRCAPNLPGSLTRSLSRRLGVDATTAMRIALLYGDMEWLANGASQVRYSASDYARRQGLHRHTVASDLRRLVDLQAIQVSTDSCSAPWIHLHGLHETEPVDLHASPVDPSAIPLSMTATPPCRAEHHPPVEQIDNPLSRGATTLEKGLKEEQKEERKEEGQPHQIPPRTGSALVSSQVREQAPPKGGVEPFGMSSGPLYGGVPRAGSQVLEQEILQGQDRSQTPTTASGLPSVPCGKHRPIDHPFRAQPVSPSRPCLLREAPPEREGGASQTGGHTAGHGPNIANALLDRLLTAYRAAKPAEWPVPSALSLSPARKGKLQAALRYAGSPEALEQRLKAALTHVPPWYRNTYPVRPDGSPRPAHQFFDVLFRATGDEREGGLEAWHLFAWSEAGSRGAVAGLQSAGQGVGQGVVVAGSTEPARETDLERARRLFVWDTPNWRLRAIEAYSLSMAERRRLTGLLEAEGEAYPGAGAFEFADPPDPAPTAPAAFATSSQEAAKATGSALNAHEHRSSP